MAREEESRFKILGHEIELDLKPEEPSIRFDKDYVIVTDPSGELFSKCHVFLVRALRGTRRDTDGHVNGLFRAVNWHHSTRFPYNAHVQIPHGRWRVLAEVKWIGYRRSDLGDMSHDFEKRVTVSVCGDVAARLNLPAGCILNERGFVYP